jgi:hypothetical protein
VCPVAADLDSAHFSYFDGEQKGFLTPVEFGRYCVANARVRDADRLRARLRMLRDIKARA